MSANVAYRMSSLLPTPFGCGSRRNDRKRSYVLEYLRDIEYRTLACASAAEATEIERQMMRNRVLYLFGS